VRDPEVSEMPGEIGAELVAVIGLDPLNRDRQSPANLVDEGNGVGDRVPRVDLQHPVSGRLVNGGELIEAAGAELQVLDVNLDGLAGMGKLAAATRPGR
jgi:hypothetical protein